MTGRPLPSAAPSSQGVDARGVLTLLDALEAHPLVDPHSLVLVRHGHVVAQGWWSPFAREQPHLLYSLSKSFTSAGLGLAVAEGLLGLDDRLVDVLPELADAAAGERARAITLRHLVAMSSGHLAETWDDAVELDPDEPLRGFLGIELDRDPGTVFAYNQPCTYAVSAAVQRASGQTLVEFLRPRLLDPLGVGPVGWQQHPAGRDLGFSGLHAATDAVAKLGLLHLQRGTWQGKQLLPAAWVDEAVSAHVSTPHQEGTDWRQGYGFQFWRQRHGYRGDGAYGQFCVVLPEHDAVLAITSDTPDMQGVLDAAWTHLLPAMSDASSGRDAALADAELAERLAGLALSPAPGAAAPSDPSAWDGVVLLPSPRLRQGDAEVDQVRVEHRRAGGDSGWRLVLDEGGWVLDARIGVGEWALTDVPAPERLGGGAVPVAVSGGWSSAAGRESLRVEVRFLQTPHRLVVSGEAATASARARWVTVPLRAGSLAELRAPFPLG